MLYVDQSLATGSQTVAQRKKIFLQAQWWKLFLIQASFCRTLGLLQGNYFIISFCYKEASLINSVKFRFIYSNRSSDDNDPIVDVRFVALLKTTCARLAGQNRIPHDFIDYDFWSKWPKKFRERKRYEKKLAKKNDAKRKDVQVESALVHNEPECPPKAKRVIL